MKSYLTLANTKTGSFRRRPILKFLYLFVVLAFAGLKADAAEIYCNTVYKGIGTTYTANTNSIQISAATLVAGTNFSFISLDPNDPLFVGNNVPGNLTYKNSSGVLVTIKGVVSRANKTGNVGQAAYFYVVDNLGAPTGEAYLLVFPGFESLFPGAGTFSSASNGVSDVLNVVLLESPRVNVTGTLTAVAGCGGQASTPQTVTVDGANLTANINITAPTGYEISFSSGTGYASSLSITPVSGTVPSTTVYVRLTSTALNGATGDVLFKSTGAADRGVNTGIATITGAPVISVSPASASTYPGQTTALTASGAVTYTWTPATALSATTGATVNANPLVTTIYTVAGTSALGCIGSKTVTITVGPALAGGSVSASQSICTGTAPAALTSTAAATGGSATYNYQWQTSSDNSSFTDIPGATSAGYTPSTLTATTYFRRKVTDAVTSAFSNVVTITVNDLPTISVSPASATIFPGGNTGLTASGASTYAWSPSTGLSATTGATVTADPAATTTYTVVGTSAAGCSNNTTVTVTVGAGLAAGSISASQTICANIAPAALSSTTAASGGSSVYTYQWQSSTDNVNFTDISGASATGYTPGSLSVTTYFRRKVSDGVATEFSNTVTINVNDVPAVGVFPSTATIFPGGSKTLTAFGASTYAWSPSTGLSASTGAVVSASPAATTTYTIVGTSSDGCIASVTATITVGPALTPGSISASQAICDGTAPNSLTSTSAVSGGSGVYAYQWQSSTDNVSFTDISGETSGDYAPGTLSVTTYYRRKVTDAMAAIVLYSNTVTITVNAIPAVGVSPASATIFPGGNRTLTAFGASTYTWSPSTGLSATSGAVVSASPATATTYTVVGVSADGCSASATVLINVGPALDGGQISASQAICSGTVPAAFTTTTAISGGSGVYSYQWQRSTDNVSFTDISGATSEDYAPGTLVATTYYRRKATDGVATAYSNSITITVNDIPVVGVFPAAATIFPGGSKSVTAFGASTYSWSPSTGLSATTGAVVIASPAATTVYTVTGTSAQGCSATATLTINVGPDLTGGAISASQAICSGTAPATLNTSVAISGGSGVYAYQWQSSSDNISFTDISGETSETYTSGNLTATTYFRRKVTDGVATEYSNTVTITVNAVPVVSVSPASATIFPGGNTSLTASGASTYVWSPATGLSATTGATVTANPAATTTYTVVGTSAQGCSNNTTVTVTVGPGLAAGSISSSQAICANTAPAGLTGGTAPSGGSGVYTFQWQSSTDNVSFTDISGATAADYAPGTLSATTYYRRKVSDAVGSVNSNTVTITVNQIPVITVTPATASIFPGGNVSLTASGASTYSWSPATGLSATTGATVIASPAANTTYTVTGISAQGCTGSVSVTVTVGAPLAAGTISADQLICSGSSPAALASVAAATGGSGTYVYQWQSSTDNVSFSDISGATSAGYTPGALTTTTYYRRKVSDAVGSAFSNTVAITFSNVSTPVITAAGATTFCEGGSVVLTSSAAASYTWYLNGETIVGAVTQSYRASTSGRYTVITGNANSCKSIESAATTVVVNAPPTAPSAITGDSVVVGGYAYTYTALGSPTATSYIWTLPSGWSGTSTTNTINATSASSGGVISVVAVSNGCASAATNYPVRVKFDKVTIPDVITPNGDGFNDKLKILKPSTMKVSLAIFNRWGQQVYKSADYKNDWDGTGTGGFVGNLLPNGTYFYLVELTGAGITKKEVMKGSITLKRN